ncbi:MAG TPA: hypothetical protein VMH02_05905 [Verrucomicrobiae bacterium]|nr:hypothetical protein [Verrucomicrobiae bacterium]
MGLTRGELIRTGIGGAALLALASCARSSAPAAPPFDDPGYHYAILGPSDRVMFAALASAMLAGALPSGSPGGVPPLVQVVRGVDVVLAGLLPAQLAEVQQLFSLLEFPVTRALACGIWSGWREAGPGDVAQFLERWRFSGVELFRSGYQALHTILSGAWYGNANSWPRIGYPGPPPL